MHLFPLRALVPPKKYHPWRRLAPLLPAVGHLLLLLLISSPGVAAPSSPLLPERKALLDRWQPHFSAEYEKLEPRFQISFACVLEKIIEDQVLLPELAGVRDVWRGGLVQFNLAARAQDPMGLLAARGLQDYLLWKGYTGAYLAGRNREWGLRSPRTGAQLHWYAPPETSGIVEVHIDLANPGGESFTDDPAPYIYRAHRHIETDFEEGAWMRNHTPYRLLRETGNHCGLRRDFFEQWRNTDEF